MPDYACFRCGAKNELLNMKIEKTRDKISQPKYYYCCVTVRCTNKNCIFYGISHGERACKFFKRVYQEPEKEGQLDLFEEVAV